ncbi:hypothetical protein D3C81_1868680 [compost metagenome]
MQTRTEVATTPAFDPQVQQVSGAGVLQYGKGLGRGAEDQTDAGGTDGRDDKGARGNAEDSR